jgi:hypothetical protein
MPDDRLALRPARATLERARSRDLRRLVGLDGGENHVNATGPRGTCGSINLESASTSCPCGGVVEHLPVPTLARRTGRCVARGVVHHRPGPRAKATTAACGQRLWPGLFVEAVPRRAPPAAAPSPALPPVRKRTRPRRPLQRLPLLWRCGQRRGGLHRHGAASPASYFNDEQLNAQGSCRACRQRRR